MDRRDLEKHLKEHGCEFHHHGGRHDVWIHQETLKRAPVPRHNTLKRGTARGICKLLGISAPAGL